MYENSKIKKVFMVYMCLSVEDWNILEECTVFVDLINKIWCM